MDPKQPVENDARTASSERSALSLYMNEIKAIERLTEEEELEVRRGLAAGDPEAAHRLVRSHLGFVVKVAMEYRGVGLAFEDLLSEGNLGLLEASRRFDGDRGTRFTTYAIWWIRKAILSAVSGKAALVRAPAEKERRLRQIRQASHELRPLLGREPTREEVSRHLSRSPAEIDRLLRHRTSVQSLDQPVTDEGGLRLEHLLRDDRAPTPERQVLDRERGGNLVEALETLAGREREILIRRFGLDGNPAESLHEIGARIGLSRERVRQIEVQAREKVRRALSRRHAFGRAGDRALRRRTRTVD